jgi:hypothetical protein
MTDYPRRRPAAKLGTDANESRRVKVSPEYRAAVAKWRRDLREWKERHGKP